MTGKIIYTPSVKDEHARRGCSDMPETTVLLPGTIWQCDECDEQWVVVHGSQYNESYQAWRRLTESNREGRDR